MSEFEFFNTFPDLKVYKKIADKNFPRFPHNSFKVSNTMRIKYLDELLGNKISSNCALKWSIDKEGPEFTPQLNFYNGDKIYFTYGKKSYTLGLISIIKKREIKVLEYILTLDKASKNPLAPFPPVIKHCKLDIKTKNFGDFSIGVFDKFLKLQNKEKTEPLLESDSLHQEDVQFKGKHKKYKNEKKCDSEYLIHNPKHYVLKFSFHKKFFNFFDTKLNINSNEKEYNNLEIKTEYKIPQTYFKLYNSNVVSFNLQNIHKKIDLSKNIFGLSYKRFIGKNDNNIKLNEKEDLDIEMAPRDEIKDKFITNKFDKSSINFALGTIFQNVKFYSIHFGMYFTHYIQNYNISVLRSRIELIHAFHLSLFNKKKQPLESNVNINPSFITQYSTKSILGKWKVNRSSIKSHHEITINNLMKFDLIDIKKASLAFSFNIHKKFVNGLESGYNFNYGFSLNFM